MSVELVEPLDRLVDLLRRVQRNATPDLFAETYTQSQVAVETWLPEAIQIALELQAEARGDVLEPGGEHGGVAD
jgi:hypothetical protein